MSDYDEPNHLSPEQEPIELGERYYSDEEMKAFQHGTASPFMPPELMSEIVEESQADKECSLKQNAISLNRFFKKGLKK